MNKQIAVPKYDWGPMLVSGTTSPQEQCLIPRLPDHVKPPALRPAMFRGMQSGLAAPNNSPAHAPRLLDVERGEGLRRMNAFRMGPNALYGARTEAEQGFVAYQLQSILNEHREKLLEDFMKSRRRPGQ